MLTDSEDDTDDVRWERAERCKELDERTGRQGSIVISYYSSIHRITLPSIQQRPFSVLYLPRLLHDVQVHRLP